MVATKKKHRKLASLKRIQKLSTLLAIGLRDLRKQERAKNCIVDMGIWWMPSVDKTDECVTCLAGSVMKFGLKKPRGHGGEEIMPEDYDRRTGNCLWALNSLRSGGIQFAARLLSVTTNFDDRRVADYEDERDQWWADMKQLLADLRAAGE